MVEVSGTVPAPFGRIIESSDLLCQPAAIGTLPDDGLLENFSFYVESASEAERRLVIRRHPCARHGETSCLRHRVASIRVCDFICTGRKTYDRDAGYFADVACLPYRTGSSISSHGRAWRTSMGSRRSRLTSALFRLSSWKGRTSKPCKDHYYSQGKIFFFFSNIGSATVLPDSFLGESL